MPSSSPAVPWRPAPWTRSRLCWALQPAARGFEAEPEWPAVEAYRALLGGACPVEFRRAAPRPRGRRRALRRVDDRSYDAVICEERAVPTRARSWHDLFNALVWATFPRTKTALHARQLRAQTARGDALDGRRTREQDALALLDEGGVALLCEEASLAAARAALDARDAEAIGELVGRGASLGVVYGHAIYEQLACGGPAVRAMVHLVACATVPIEASSCIALADAGLARALADEASFTQPEALRSLPVTLEVLGSRP